MAGIYSRRLAVTLMPMRRTVLRGRFYLIQPQTGVFKGGGIMPTFVRFNK